MQTQTNMTHTAALLYDLQQLLLQIRTCNAADDTELRNLVGQLSQHGLNMLHYALFAIESQQTTLPFTSVSAGAAMYDVVQELRPLTRGYGVSIELVASPHLEPVYTNETSLKGSVFALLTAIITSQLERESSRPQITLAVQQTKPNQQRIGVYSSNTPLHLSMLRQQTAGRITRMDPSGLSHRSGLGFMVSRLLTERMDTRFAAFEHQQNSGIGFYVPQSAQLQLL